MFAFSRAAAALSASANQSHAQSPRQITSGALLELAHAPVPFKVDAF